MRSDSKVRKPKEVSFVSARRKVANASIDPSRKFPKIFISHVAFSLQVGSIVVENMEDSVYNKYGIDPNRIPTDVEVELVAYCFDVSLQEAESILTYRNRRLINFHESNLCTRSIHIRKENAHG